MFRLGSTPPDMSSPCVVEENSNNSYSTHPVVGRSGQILWIRGLTRLQTQVGLPVLSLATGGSCRTLARHCAQIMLA